MPRILCATLVVALRLAAGGLSPLFSFPDQITATAIDSSNNLYIAANILTVQGGSIPTTGGVYLPSAPGCASGACSRGLIVKLSSSGTVIFATYFGTDDGGDAISAIAVDSAGNIFIAGRTTPILVPGQNNEPVGFIQKLAADGSRIVGSYSIVGGLPAAIALSPSGDVFATGQTIDSAAPSNPALPCGCQFITTAGAFQGAAAGGTDAFAIHLDPALSQPIYSTIIGGSGSDTGAGITVDAAGEAYITGSTSSASFPVTPGSYRQSASAPGAPIAFVVKLNTSGSGLIFAAQFNPTTLSNFGSSTGAAVAVDDSGVYVAGITVSLLVDLSPNAFLTTGTQFLAKLAPDGSRMIAQTLMPGPAGANTLPALFKIAIDASGDVMVMSHSDTLAPISLDAFAPCTTGPGGTVPYVVQLNSDFSVGMYGSYLPGGLAIRGDGEVWYSDSTGTLNSFNINDPLPAGIRCVADALSGFSGPIAPGKLVTLMGPGIGSDVAATQQLDSAGKVAVGLSGVNVYFNGIAAPLISVSKNRIEAVVPFENLDPVEFPTSAVVILNNGSEIDGPPVPVTAVAPVLLTDAQNCVSAFNFDGTLNSSANPAPLGSLMAIFGEGAGLMRPAITGGIGNGHSQIVAPITVTLQGGTFLGQPLQARAAIPYAGDTPGFVEGIFEVNLILPASFNNTGQEALQVQIGGTLLNACVWVKPAN